MLPPARFFERVPATVLQPEAITDSKYGSVGARGCAGERLRDDRGGRGAAGRRARPHVPVLGPDRRRSGTGTGRRTRCSTPRSCARSTRWRRSRRRCSSPPTTARSTSTSPTSSTSSGRRCSTTCASTRPARRATCSCTSTSPRPWCDALAARLGDRARVCLAAELFPDAGPRLRERLADVCVLPAPGRMVGAAGVLELRAPLQGPPRRPDAGGVRDLDRHDGVMDTGVSTAAARPRHRRAVRAAAPAARRHELRPQPDPAPPRPARAHPPPRAAGGGLPRARGHAHADRRGRDATSSARASSSGSRPRSGARSSTGSPARTCCCSRSAAPASTSAATARRSSPGSRRRARRRRRSRCPRTSHKGQTLYRAFMLRIEQIGRLPARVVGRAHRRRARPVRHGRRPDGVAPEGAFHRALRRRTGRSPRPGSWWWRPTTARWWASAA